MSVLIRGMKMPEDCPVCPLAHWNKLDRFTGCELIKRYFDKEDMETRGRPSFCPLIEIHPHGRLIDALEINEVKWVHPDTAWQMGWNSAIDSILENAQTIIEAEEGE